MPSEFPPELPAAATAEVDVAIIGAGAAGTCAAAALVRQGHSVVLFDAHERHQPDFRAEKIGAQQMDYLTAFGLGDAAHRQMTAFDGVWVHRFGRIIEKKTTREYASEYPDLVNALRDGLPPQVKLVVGRIDEVTTGADRQTVGLADGRRFTARLLIVATGLGDTIRRKLGIDKTVLSEGHSLSFGFDLANPASDFPFPSLVWTIEGREQQGAYISLFPIRDRVRANLFVYRKVNDPWTMTFRKDTANALHAFLPTFESTFGRISVDGPVSARPIDLMQSKGYRRPGMVLIGDAFCTTDPITGTGIDKALNDVDVLRKYVPEWLATPGMASEKIAQYYADPTKLARDAHALKISRRARSMRMDGGLLWGARRLRTSVVTRGAYRLRELLRPAPSFTSGAGSAGPISTATHDA